MSLSAHRARTRYAELSERLRQAAQAGDLDAVSGALAERAELLPDLGRAPGSPIPAAELAEIRRADLEARAALEELSASVREELRSVRAGREAAARARLERSPRLLSRRV